MADVAPANILQLVAERPHTALCPITTHASITLYCIPCISIWCASCCVQGLLYDQARPWVPSLLHQLCFVRNSPATQQHYLDLPLPRMHYLLHR
jgi:hypothetical protein